MVKRTITLKKKKKGILQLCKQTSRLGKVIFDGGIILSIHSPSTHISMRRNVEVLKIDNVKYKLLT